MLSRAEPRAATSSATVASSEQALRVIGTLLHGLAFVAMILLFWRLRVSPVIPSARASVNVDGALNTSVDVLLRARSDSLDIELLGVPDARSRALLRAVRGSGHHVRIAAPVALPVTAVALEEEWRTSGGTRVQLIGGDSASRVIRDGAGLIDSVRIDRTGLRSRLGPVMDVLHADAAGVRASAAAIGAALPAEARVLVLGDATWESRFLVAALEEAGWPVDVGVTLSPRVIVTQGASLVPSRARHAIVVLLPGASPSAVRTLPAFVRSGGGLVIVGEAARSAALGTLRAGAPAATVSGEIGAEASAQPRHGLDLVPIAALASGSVSLESRDGQVAVAARRVGAGRVIQVGYDNSWLWRMAGNDDAPVAHRRWWSALLSGIVPRTAPVSRNATDAEHDTLDAAPVAAMARDLGLPVIRPTLIATTATRSFAASLDPVWLLVLAVISLVASWTLRRWRGLP